ncbi:MAG: DUF1631 family protein [Oleiphilaceae bacterium]|nr:DUF1631 family protein [Oleiphilaceae bacterium]
MNAVEAIIRQLRVPGLPYPVGQQSGSGESDWTGFLADAWQQQTDLSVMDLLSAEESVTWSMTQVNAGYLADRIMDVFLQKSGLHPTLVARVARLRFWLAWDLHQRNSQAVGENAPLREWLDSLHWLKGWSETGGRSDRQMFSQLDTLQQAVTEAFSAHSDAPVNAFFSQWLELIDSQHRKAATLQQRLLKTEQGAALQRASENAAQAALGRALQGRALPLSITRFLLDDWHPVLRQAVRRSGVGSQQWRHAHRLLEWLVWVADPSLSGNARDKLYQVGEQLVEKMHSLVVELWPGASTRPQLDYAVVESLLVLRMRGEEPELEPAPELAFDSVWLEAPSASAEARDWEGQWYLYLDGEREIRQFLFCYLEDTGEVLWTNGFGMKLGIQSFSEARAELSSGYLQCLPPLHSFGTVLNKTLESLSQLLAVQQKKRQQALLRAREEAEALRRAREAQEAAEQQRIEDQRLLEEAAARRSAEDARERERIARQNEERARHDALLALVDAVHLGGWVELDPGTGKARRLKLALRIKASGKLVFVDRLGLNRETLNRYDLAAMLLEERAKILDQGAEFEDTLSRVVGRIRVGR